MNRQIFDSMQEQMAPGPEVRAALKEKLARTAKERPGSRVKYGAVAACAALALCAYPIYRAVRPGPPALHSYVSADGSASTVTEDTQGAADTGGGGDQDMDMTPEELAQAMREVGYTQEEIDAYQSIGYRMTWANWWKFVHEHGGSEDGDPFDLEGLRAFSQRELYVATGALPAPNTGDLPGGAYIGDAPAQEEASAAYQELMDRFGTVYPDWYGGAYIDGSGYLTVLLVESEDPGDKTLELQVLDWTGSDRVVFASAKYSLARLNELMAQLDRLPETDPKCGAVMAGWGVDEEENRIELTLTEIDGHILSVLAELDPEDDAIYVQVGQRASLASDTEGSVRRDVMPGGTTVPEGGDPVAGAPAGDLDGAHYGDGGRDRELPEEEQPAVVESAPEEDPIAPY